MLKEINVQDLKIGDFVFNGVNNLKVDFIQRQKNQNGQIEILRIDSYNVIAQGCVEFEIVWFKNIQKAYKNAVHTETKKNYIKGQKTIPSPDFGYNLVRTERIKETSNLQEFATDNQRGQDTSMVDGRIFKMIEVNRAKAIRSMSSIEKQAYAIMYNLNIHKKKEFEGLAEAERVANELGLKITRYYFKLVRDKKNNK
jgi:hypothetical protein